MKVDLDEVLHVSETTITIRGSRRRTTVPAEIVDILELGDGDKIRWVALKRSQIFIMKVGSSIKKRSRARKHLMKK
jgi:bifunctional DNA-binding transcriptional regulator/antitoxin component of YhaV-PrlF toxin-antitoxin module